MFIWDFVAAKVLGQIVDWFYSQIVGFLGNFFSEMGNMGAELFTMDWVQSIVLFFSYLAWALYGTGLVVACFETGVEYSSGRGNIRETDLNAIKGFMTVSLFTIRPDGRAAAGLRQHHQRDHDPVLPYPHGLCRRQGLLRQSQARRHPADPDRRGKPLYVQCPSRIYRRLYPMMQADHRPMPVGVLAGDDPCRRTYGVQGSCPVRAWTHALRR